VDSKEGSPSGLRRLTTAVDEANGGRKRGDRRGERHRVSERKSLGERQSNNLCSSL
jgi:hypothetical protein